MWIHQHLLLEEVSTWKVDTCIAMYTITTLLTRQGLSGPEDWDGPPQCLQTEPAPSHTTKSSDGSCYCKNR